MLNAKHHLPDGGKDSERDRLEAERLYGAGTVQKVADRFYASDDGMRGLYRIQRTTDSEPLTLLTITENTIESGITPIYIHGDIPLCIVAVTPDEFDGIMVGEPNLPSGWRLAERYHPTPPFVLTAEGGKVTWPNRDREK